MAEISNQNNSAQPNAFATDGHEITRVLEAASGGDSKAADELLKILYDDLRQLAQARMRREPAGMTLQATALVHEAYMRVVGPGDPDQPKPQWDNRGHFFGAAALAMRRILVERARHRKRIKHGGEIHKVDIGDQITPAAPEGVEPTDLIALDEALVKLEKLDPRKAKVVSLRYFAGLSVEEVAGALDISPATVKNDWTFARAWLQRELSE